MRNILYLLFIHKSGALLLCPFGLPWILGVLLQISVGKAVVQSTMLAVFKCDLIVSHKLLLNLPFCIQSLWVGGDMMLHLRDIFNTPLDKKHKQLQLWLKVYVVLCVVMPQSMLLI